MSTSSNPACVIEARELSRYYGEKAALDRVSFSITKGQIVGFLGLNGAGKSTALKILAGLLQPSGGEVRIGGVDLYCASERLRARIGYLPDDATLYGDMLVSEFLQWCGQLRGQSAAAVRERLPEVARACHIEEVRDALIGELSYGYRKRVGIAQAMIHRPEFLILDEPISGLDPVQIVEMREVIRGLREHSTVLISSHILPEVAQTCDRILVLHEGRIVAEGSEEDLAALVGKKGRVEVVVRASEEHLRTVLEASMAVHEYNLSPHEDGFLHAELVLAGDTREAVVKDLVNAGIGVRRVDDGQGELESIFVGLTQSGAGAGELRA